MPTFKNTHVMKSFYIFCLLLLVTSHVCSQKPKENRSEINIGIGLSQPDMRLDFLGSDWGAKQIIENAFANKPLFEYDIFINYSKKIIGNERLKLYIGVGYLMNLNKVRIPINNAYFTDPNLDTDLVLRFNRNYLKHNLSFPIEGRLHLKNNKLKNLLVTFGLNHNITVFKQINPPNDFLSDFSFEPSETEVYTGLRYEKNDWGYYLQYRLVNIQYKDDALENNGKDVDYFNPIKFRIGMIKMF